jgi:hypothetical protein
MEQAVRGNGSAASAGVEGFDSSIDDAVGVSPGKYRRG